ncbi:MAG: hypothetical protein ACT4PZ_18880 [Panacagrimonas sp.]
MNRIKLAGYSGILIGALSVGTAMAAPMDRRLEITLTVEGTQDWRNELQWSKATTSQRYDFATTLRSDGKLEGANLLDKDQETRLAIKTEYLRRQGLAQLKAQGLDPSSPDLQRQISAGMQKESFACEGEPICFSEVNAKYSTIMAAVTSPDNSALFEGEPRYLFFSGFPSCANRIHSVNKTQTKGETAFGRKKDKLSPFALDRQGDSQGSLTEQKSLCTFYTVVVDTKEQKMFVENVNIPPARGTSVRTEFGTTLSSQDDLPVASEAMDLVNTTLRDAPLSGSLEKTVVLTTPLDGNATVLGSFLGNAKVSLKWAFVDGAAAKK